MSKDGMAAVDEATAVSKADHDKAVAIAREEGRKEGLAAGKAESDKAVADTARAEGATAERARILGIEGLGLKGHEKLVGELKADGKTTPAEAAIKIVQAEKAAGGKMLASLLADGGSGAAAARPAEPSGGGVADSTAILADKSKPLDERCKAAFEADDKLRAEFGTLSVFMAYQRALEGGQAKVFKPAR